MEIVVFGNICTDVYRLESCSPKSFSNLKIIVIPGNPGLIEFYRSFIDTLHKKLDQKVTIVGIGHAGHGAVGKNGKTVFSLQNQIQHKIEFLESFPPETEFIILGHSIGAYIALKAMKRSPNLKVRQVVNLFPTIRHLWDGLTPFKKFIILPGVRNSLSCLAHYAPTSLMKHVSKLGVNVVEEVIYAASKYLDYHVCMNVLSMAYDESLEVLEVDEEIHTIINEHLPKMIFLYGPNDKYANKVFYEDIKSECLLEAA